MLHFGSHHGSSKKRPSSQEQSKKSGRFQVTHPTSKNPGSRRQEPLTPWRQSWGRQVPHRARCNHGRRGGGVVGIAQAEGPGDVQRRAKDAEEGAEVEEQRPDHDAERDPRRPPEQPGAGCGAAYRRSQRGPLLGHGAFFLLVQRFCAGLATTGDGGAQEGALGRYRAMA